MRVLITGGAGFIGSNLVPLLLERGDEVRVFDDLSAGVRPSWWTRRSDVECRQGDIQDLAAVRRAARSIEGVVHLAARPGVADSVNRPDLDFRANVLGTFNVFDASRREGVGHMVFASSGAVLAGVRPPLREDMPPAPLSPYGASKLYGEGLMRAGTVFGIIGVSLRFANVYGPHSAHKASVVPSFVRRALSGRPMVVFGSGRQTRDFLYAEDVSLAIERGLRARRPGLYHIGTGVETSINQLAGMVAGACGARMAIERRPARSADSPRNFVDVSAAARRLGWRPRVGLEEGLARTVQWIRSRDE